MTGPRYGPAARRLAVIRHRPQSPRPCAQAGAQGRGPCAPDPGPGPYEGDGPPYVRHLRAERRPADPPAALRPATASPSATSARHRAMEPLGPSLPLRGPTGPEAGITAGRRPPGRPLRAQPTAVAGDFVTPPETARNFARASVFGIFGACRRSNSLKLKSEFNAEVVIVRVTPDTIAGLGTDR